jgi:hypothetical protein
VPNAKVAVAVDSNGFEKLFVETMTSR